MAQLFRDMLALLVAAALLWLVYLYGRLAGDGALLVIWAVMSLAIAAGLVWRRRIRRRSFLAAYIAPTSGLQRLLRGGIFMILTQTVLAAILGAVLLIALTRSPGPGLWTLLILAAPLLAVVNTGIRHGFREQVSPVYLSEFSLRTSSILLGLALVAALMYLAMQRSYPNFSGISLDRAIWHMVSLEHSRSPRFLALLQMAAAGDALRLWLGQQLLPALSVPLYQWLGWLVVSVREIVFVWSYLLLCQGTLMGVNRDARR